MRDSPNSSHESPPVENANVRHDSRTNGNREDLRGSLQRHLPQYHTSPPYTTDRAPQHDGSDTQRNTPLLPLPATNHTSNGASSQEMLDRHLGTYRPQRPPLERNLNVSDFPLPPRIPTTEEVMEELREVTYQYTNCPDPAESAARRHRVLDSEARGLMEETAARMIAAATVTASSPAQQLICFQPEEGYAHTSGQEIIFMQAEGDAVANLIPSHSGISRAGRPPKSKQSTPAQRRLRGPNLRKHNQAISQRSPSTRSTANAHKGDTSTRSTRRRTSHTGSHTRFTPRTNDRASLPQAPPTQRREPNQSTQSYVPQEEESQPQAQQTHQTPRRTNNVGQPASQNDREVDFHHPGRDLP